MHRCEQSPMHEHQQRKSMPGYRSLSTHLSGTAADHAREAELRAALLDLSPRGDTRLRACLAQLCADGHDRDVQMEDLVSALKSAWAATPVPPELTPEGWHERWSNALVVLLALYFGEAA